MDGIHIVAFAEEADPGEERTLTWPGGSQGWVVCLLGHRTAEGIPGSLQAAWGVQCVGVGGEETGLDSCLLCPFPFCSTSTFLPLLPPRWF